MIKIELNDLKRMEFKSLKEDQTRMILSKKLEVPTYVYLFCGLIVIILVVIWWVF